MLGGEKSVEHKQLVLLIEELVGHLSIQHLQQDAYEYFMALERLILRHCGKDTFESVEINTYFTQGPATKDCITIDPQSSTFKNALQDALDKEIRRIVTLPEVCQFYIKRFQSMEVTKGTEGAHYDADLGKYFKGAVKVTNALQFPSTLSFDEKYLEKETVDKTNLYHIYMFTVHLGSNIDSGHYIVLVKFAADRWWHINDDIVTDISEMEAFKIAGENAVLAYYIDSKEFAKYLQHARRGARINKKRKNASTEAAAAVVVVEREIHEVEEAQQKKYGDLCKALSIDGVKLESFCKKELESLSSYTGQELHFRLMDIIIVGIFGNNVSTILNYPLFRELVQLCIGK
jgi:ubiquitin C-terminal hydrolase